jgi:hypothetical protein
MFPSPLDLTVPDQDQERIVSRITPSVASERGPTMHAVIESESCRKMPKNKAFRVQLLRFCNVALVATQ